MSDKAKCPQGECPSGDYERAGCEGPQGSASESPALNSSIERLRAALNLVLTFYTAPYWTPDLRSDWKEATGSGEATTKVLCDYIRRTLDGEPRMSIDGGKDIRL